MNFFCKKEIETKISGKETKRLNEENFLFHDLNTKSIWRE